MVALGSAKIGIEEHIGVAQYGGHWRPDLVTHVGQEGGFGPGRGKSRGIGGLQLGRPFGDAVLKALVELTDPDLILFPLGDVDVDAHDPHRCTGIVEERTPLARDPANCSIGPDDPILCIVGYPVDQRLPCRQPDGGAIVVVHEGQVLLEIEDLRIIGASIEHVESILISDAIGDDVPFPVAQPCGGESASLAFVALTKSLHRSLPLGDVARDLGNTDDTPRTVSDRRDRQRHIDQPAVIGQPHRLEVVHAFSAHGAWPGCSPPRPDGLSA